MATLKIWRKRLKSGKCFLSFLFFYFSFLSIQCLSLTSYSFLLYPNFLFLSSLFSFPSLRYILFSSPHVRRQNAWDSCSREVGLVGRSPSKDFATNDDGLIGGISLYDLSQSDFRGTANPITYPVENYVNMKFKEHMLHEVKTVWKVINRRQVICYLASYS